MARPPASPGGDEGSVVEAGGTPAALGPGRGLVRVRGTAAGTLGKHERRNDGAGHKFHPSHLVILEKGSIDLGVPSPLRGADSDADMELRSIAASILRQIGVGDASGLGARECADRPGLAGPRMETSGRDAEEQEAKADWPAPVPAEDQWLHSPRRFG